MTNPAPLTVEDPFALAARAADVLKARTGQATHELAVVLGSGWQPVADGLAPDGVEQPLADVPLSDLPGFPVPTAAGHVGSVRSIRLGSRRVLLFLGRVHLYEGHSPNQVVHAVRTAAAAGCGGVILTNAAGGIRSEWAVGQVVLVSDHINLTAASPLAGPPPPPPFGSRFCDLTDAYSPRLRTVAHAVDRALAEGVYAGFPGPHYETPAEVRMARALGADLVGMSTVLETIAARHLGLEVLGISVVTNAAAGLGLAALDSAEVVAAAGAVAGRLAGLLRGVLERWP
ncbi:MAG: purine-nucleoside phosphorylase [Candidatus Dormibacteraeota bacterium]|nr:purine-nucleoside phosphorylase [Candidatus Dormibacteraeota bacterium]